VGNSFADGIKHCWHLVCGFVIIYESLYWHNKTPTVFTLLILLDYFLKVVPLRSEGRLDAYLVEEEKLAKKRDEL